MEVRNLFETDINVDEDGESEIEKELASSYHRHDYSRFYYFNEFDQMSGNTINDMVAQYLHGCKLYCVFSKKAQMLVVIKALDTALTQRGLVRNRDNIEIAFDEQKSHTPLAESVGDMFMGFHCSMSVLSAPFDKNTTSFAIPNGSYSSAQKRILKKLSEQSQFNFEQYQVEHATPEKNIVIRAGAGTGKTYTMISRIGFICYTQNVPLQKMADRIVMITFTNEAADQMEEKLKAYFKNCYLVTSKPDYLQMISQIDHMQISTIHSYAKNLIAQMGTSFGYGIDLSITSSEFYRRKKISDLLDAYIYQKEMEQGKNYTDKLGMPVYAIRDSILDFIGKLHNKSVDIGAIEPQDFGTLLNNESHGELHELLASVIPAVEREYFEELIEDNKASHHKRRDAHPDLMLANTVDKNNKWEYIVASLRTQPILQAIRKVYNTLEPWKHFSNDPWKQHYYQLNVDLLFEQIINACNVDRLTINTLQEHLHNSIVSQVSVDSRTPAQNEEESAIQCITVHKSKGLEYGHVIMPFCSASMDFIKRTQLQISATKYQGRYRIGYSMSVSDSGETVQNDFYDEIIEKSEKAREEARVLYVAMTRSIRSFSWIEIQGKQNLSWQNLIETEV